MRLGIPVNDQLNLDIGRPSQGKVGQHRVLAAAGMPRSSVQPQPVSAMLKTMNRGRPWTNADRTGGPIDDVFDQLRQCVHALIIERLEAIHPADDDNVYFIGDQYQLDRIQVDTAPGGQPPFLIENGGRHEATDTTEAVTLIRDWLGQD